MASRPCTRSQARCTPVEQGGRNEGASRGVHLSSSQHPPKPQPRPKQTTTSDINVVNNNVAIAKVIQPVLLRPPTVLPPRPQIQPSTSTLPLQLRPAFLPPLPQLQSKDVPRLAFGSRVTKLSSVTTPPNSPSFNRKTGNKVPTVSTDKGQGDGCRLNVKVAGGPALFKADASRSSSSGLTAGAQETDCARRIVAKNIQTLVTKTSSLKIMEDGDKQTTSKTMGNANANNATLKKSKYELIDITTPTGSPVPVPRMRLLENATHDRNHRNDLVAADATTPQQLLPEKSKGKKCARLTFGRLPEDIPLMWNVEQCNCQFCGVNMPEKEGVMLSTCLHVFCQHCIKSSVENQGGVQAKCPLNEGSPFACSGHLMEKEIIAILTAEVYQGYLKQSLDNAGVNYNFECKTPNCGAWCELEHGRKTFLCYFCNKENCLSCEAIHEGLQCDEYQATKLQVNSVIEIQNIKQDTQNGFDQLQRLAQLRNWKLENIMNHLQDSEICESTILFDCPICMTEVEPGQGIILQDCLHVFCRDCIVEMIKHCDEPEVKCAYIDANYSCVSSLKPREIRALLPQDVYEQHIERSVKLAENAMVNSFHCKTPDCRGWCEVDEDEAGADFFKCFVCLKENCLKCKVIHQGISCADYKNRLVQNVNENLSEEALENMIKSGECMNCPRCSCLVQKASGCDWIVCSRCKTEICWATKGPRWGPKGRGDLTGGCKCDLKNGKPCVRTCQNCH